MQRWLPWLFAMHWNVAEHDIGFLATGTTRGDVLLPGFASMVHAETGLPVMEIASHSGLCASGTHALKNAYLHIKSGEHEAVIACASEFLSREFKHTKFEAQSTYSNGRVPFNTEFLRFMQSDGAGAAILQNMPSAKGQSLRIEWIDNKSYANQYDVSMYSGMSKEDGIRSWLDYSSIHEAADHGALNLKQDISPRVSKSCGIVPESGRFQTSFMLVTVGGSSSEK